MEFGEEVDPGYNVSPPVELTSAVSAKIHGSSLKVSCCSMFSVFSL